jgi:hypothetical protein
MPVSSLEIATTGTLYFLTSGRTSSRRSSSPVTEFNKRAALAGHQTGFQRAGHRRVDAQGHVHGLLDDLDQLPSSGAARRKLLSA